MGATLDIEEKVRFSSQIPSYDWEENMIKCSLYAKRYEAIIQCTFHYYSLNKLLPSAN